MMHRSAEFSADRLYRRRLDRWWAPGPRIGWLMCNPSDAGEDKDDPTVRKCTGFTSRWGYCGFTIVNPFDVVLTDSNLLHRVAEPASARNAEVIAAVARDIELLVVAWGCESVMRRIAKRGLDPRDSIRLMLRANPNLDLQCLGTSPAGNPYHPLMLAYATPLIPFEVRA
jgi:hypothetical protein